MPSQAAQPRADQIAVLAEWAHDIITSDTFRSALAEVVDLSTGAINPALSSPNDIANATLAFREWRHATALSKQWVVDMAHTTSRAQHIWANARRDNSFDDFAPILGQIIHLMHQKIDALGYANEPYDTLIDAHEPGMTTSELRQLFSTLRPILKRHIDRRATPPRPLPTGPFDIARQTAISHDLLRRIGFDFNRGRLDPSTHPFSTSFHPTDCRITTRFSETDIMENISSTLHEGGHALYEQGILSEWYGQPIGASASLGIHESQSRLWENNVGKSVDFWRIYLPILSHTFPEFSDISVDDFVRAINPIQPSCVRVSADEVTYNLHILIRFEIEVALFSGAITPRDLPSVWNEKMKSELGIIPPTDRDGVLQDVHWSCGGFGYFPTYTIGNVIAAQLAEAAARQIPNWTRDTQNGNWLPLRQWLHNTIHSKGRLYSANELVTQATGFPINTDAFARYLDKKF